MSRPLRIEYADAIYHVMNRGMDRKDIFFDSGDRGLFLKTLGNAVSLWRIKIHAFSLMPNHYHLLIETPLGNLSRAMRHIDGIFTQRINRKHLRDGPLFRGRFKSILVEKESYFLELIRYIHLNGVRAGLFPACEQDPHTSHRFYLNPSLAPAWLTMDLALSYFEMESRQEGSQALDRFVRDGISNDLKKILDQKKWPAILGTKDFIHKIKKEYIDDTPNNPEKPQEKALRTLSTPRQILRALRRAYDRVPVDLISVKGLKKTSGGRRAAAYLLRHYANLPYSCISKLVGIKKSRLSEICLDSQMQTIPQIRKAIELLKDRKTET